MQWSLIPRTRTLETQGPLKSLWAISSQVHCLGTSEDKDEGNFAEVEKQLPGRERLSPGLGFEVTGSVDKDQDQQGWHPQIKTPDSGASEGALWVVKVVLQPCRNCANTPHTCE